jgi:hypothetical protein
MNELRRVEHRAHDEEMHFFFVLNLDSMHAVESNEQRVRVLHNVVHVVMQNRFQELTFSRTNGLDHVLPVVRIKEEASTLGVGYEFQVFETTTNIDQIGVGADAKEISDSTEDLRRIIFEFEIAHAVHGCGG